MLKNLYTKLTGDPNEREVKRLAPVVGQINELEPELQKLSDAALRAKTDEFKSILKEATAEPRQRLVEWREELNAAAEADERRSLEDQLKAAEKEVVAAERDALDEILPEAFACVREASVRTIGLRHFDVQMIGGMVLHEGKVAEMKTGEGKTLVATLPLYLNALLGRGAHLVTVNDYLARRDAQWMGPVYHLLGLSVGILQQGEKHALLYDPEFKAATPELNALRAIPRQEAYGADITYGTNNEFGFDYLRDNMAWRLADRVQRELYYAIVDEVDNILIDEARTPLIISGPAGEASEEYYRLAELVRKLNKDHYEIDARTKSITLTEPGYDRVEELLGTRLADPDRPEQVDPEQAKVMHHLEAALKAQHMFQRDKDYIVRKGQVIIVDEFTGRLMPGRRWSDGLHQAVEAKEKVPIQQESITYATITLQNYFRLYKRLAGMTGTAKTEEDEFQKVYGLDVIIIPTNKPMVRNDQPDLVYRNEEAKWRAVTLEIAGLYAKGQPTLVGTTSIDNSERVSSRLAAPKMQLLARARLLGDVLDSQDELTDKQRANLKLVLSRSVDTGPENYEERLSARLFHEFDFHGVAELSRRLRQPVYDLARIRSQLVARGDKVRGNISKQYGWSDKDLNTLEEMGERDLKFVARIEDRRLRPDTAETLCTEISTHPDDLARIAQRFNVPVEVATEVYQDLRLQRSELADINRALIDSMGNADQVRQEYSVRPTDMDVLVKRLLLREEDVLRLGKKLGVDAEPFLPDNLQSLCEIFGVSDAAQLQTMLREGVPHSVLNAKEHEKEGHIIARAGEPHAITLATNMAGRGVDIKLGGELPEATLNQLGRILRRNNIDPYNLNFDQIADALQRIPKESYALDKEPVDQFFKYMHDRARVRELGGLRIIGTERHEARRIDNQLRGRSGRQGDPGSSRFYVSLEDEIMRRMGGKGLVDRVWIEDIPIEHSWVTGAIEQAQVKMEAYNFDIRKHLLEYDDVLNKQREIIYGQRYRILTKVDLREDLRSWLDEEVGRILGENLKGERGESRLLTHLDTLLPGFWLNENEIWPPFSVALLQRDLNYSENPNVIARKVLDSARRAMELFRDHIVQVLVAEVVNQYEQEYQTRWNELEDLAKNTFRTMQQEAEEQNRQLDGRALALGVGQAIGVPIELERGAELEERDLLERLHLAFDRRVADQIARRLEKRVGMQLGLSYQPQDRLEWNELREHLVDSIGSTYNQQADRYLAEIERELGERVKTLDDVRDLRLSSLLIGISHTRHAAFDQRTHRRIEILVPRFPWVHLAAEAILNTSQVELREQILDYWNQSLDRLEPLRGGAQAFNDLLRELMLSVVTNLWVEYLTEIEALREGIGLQAFAQRDPLVEYKRRAFAMFQDLYSRIRSQVVSNIFTYQYRGFAKLKDEDRDPASRKALEAPQKQVTPTAAPASAVAAAPRSAPGKSAQPKPAPASAGGTKRGRNDPCWCGSGRKYKNCHMSSDAGQGPAPAGNGKSRR